MPWIATILYILSVLCFCSIGSSRRQVPRKSRGREYQSYPTPDAIQTQMHELPFLPSQRHKIISKVILLLFSCYHVNGNDEFIYCNFIKVDVSGEKNKTNVWLCFKCFLGNFFLGMYYFEKLNLKISYMFNYIILYCTGYIRFTSNIWITISIKHLNYYLLRMHVYETWLVSLRRERGLIYLWVDDTKSAYLFSLINDVRLSTWKKLRLLHRG